MLVLFISLIVKENYIYAGISALIGVIAIVVNLKVSYKEEIEVDSTNFDVISEDVRKKQSKAISALISKGIGCGFEEKKINELKLEKDALSNKLNNLELEMHKLKIEADSIKDNLSNLGEIVEEIESQKSILKQIEKKEYILNLAIEKLTESYSILKSEVLPELESNIKKSIANTTNGMYKDVKYSDKQGLVFQNEALNIEPIEKLSLGTIDQIYLGFRIAIADKLANIPFIFDEAFVYFDDERLENILNLLAELSKDRQIIILTCSNRELQALQKMDIKINNVEL